MQKIIYFLFLFFSLATYDALTMEEQTNFINEKIVENKNTRHKRPRSKSETLPSTYIIPKCHTRSTLKKSFPTKITQLTLSPTSHKTSSDLRKKEPLKKESPKSAPQRLETIPEKGIFKNTTREKKPQEKMLWQPGAFAWAIYNKDPETIRTLLINSKLNPNKQDDNGNTPLHYAAQIEHQVIINLLLQDPHIIASIKNKRGKTAREEINQKNNALRATIFYRISIEKIIKHTLEKYNTTQFEEIKTELAKVLNIISNDHQNQATATDRTLPIEQPSYLSQFFAQELATYMLEHPELLKII